MRKSIFLIITILAVGLLASAQGLGEAARQARKNKRTPAATEKIFTNETLGARPIAEESPSAPSAGASATATGEKSADGAAADAKEGEKTDGPSAAEEMKKKIDDYKSKLADAKGEVATLERELDILQRENKLRAASYYADAGTRLRDERSFAEQERKYQADIAGKQKAITDAKAKLDSLREEARRAGVPAGQID